MATDMQAEAIVNVAELYAPENETIGERLRHMRDRRMRREGRAQWSLRAVEERTGIAKNRLSDLERDATDIRGTELVLLAQLYDVSSDYILGLRDTPPYLRDSASRLSDLLDLTDPNLADCV